MIFLNSASSAVALLFDLPSCGSSVKSSVHTLTQSLEYFSKSWKNIQILMNTLYIIYSNTKMLLTCLPRYLAVQNCYYTHIVDYKMRKVYRVFIKYCVFSPRIVESLPPLPSLVSTRLLMVVQKITSQKE